MRNMEKKMNKPDFYCKSFIENYNNIPKYQPKDCNEQCKHCMDIIIDHHFNKKKAYHYEQNRQ